MTTLSLVVAAYHSLRMWPPDLSSCYWGAVINPLPYTKRCKPKIRMEHSCSPGAQEITKYPTVVNLVTRGEQGGILFQGIDARRPPGLKGMVCAKRGAEYLAIYGHSILEKSQLGLLYPWVLWQKAPR